MFGYYVHNLSPFLFRFPDSDFGIRYYGLAYVLAFVIGYFLLKSLARRDCLNLPEAKVMDLMTYVALFGVMLGGRLGYMLLYNWEDFSRNPLIFFHLSEGGMASHGGILGIFVVTWIVARRNNVSWTNIGDNLVVAAPIGLFLGRLANFINGELYGRKTDVSWAIQFPSELHEMTGAKLTEVMRDVHPLLPEAERLSPRMIAEAAQTNDAVRQALAQHLTPRHPSQLYEAVLEGAVLFAILYFIRMRWKNLPFGILTGLFFVLYAVFRIAVEQLREPDAELIAGLTRGQFYSVFMILMGAAFLVFGFTKGRKLADS